LSFSTSADISPGIPDARQLPPKLRNVTVKTMISNAIGGLLLNIYHPFCNAVKCGQKLALSPNAVISVNAALHDT